MTIHKAINRPVLHAYSAEIKGGELQFPEDEILDAQWFSYEEVRDVDDLRDREYILGAIESNQLNK